MSSLPATPMSPLELAGRAVESVVGGDPITFTEAAAETRPGPDQRPTAGVVGSCRLRGRPRAEVVTFE